MAKRAASFSKGHCQVASQGTDMVALVDLTIAVLGESGRVKGGRSPAKRTLDATRFTPTLQGSGQAWLCSPDPRARPAARTAPPLGRG